MDPSPSRPTYPSLPLPSSTGKKATPSKRPSVATQRHATPSDSAMDMTQLDISKLRAHSACKNCRAKKIKCLPPPGVSAAYDPNSPPGPCQQCIQGKYECIYPPTRDRAAYSRQYVQNLEARVQALEGFWGRIIPMVESYEQGAGIQAGPGHHSVYQISGGRDVHSNSNGNGSGSGPGMGPRGGPQDEYNLARMKAEDEDRDGDGDGDGDDGEDEEEEVQNEDGGQITQDERGNYRWIGSSNPLSLLDSFSSGQQPNDSKTSIKIQTENTSNPSQPDLSRHSSATNPYFAPVAGAGVVKALPTVDEVSYPPHSAAREMVDAFFVDVHPTLPVLYEHDFRKEFDSLMERRSRGEIESAASQTFVSVLFAVFALGERVLVTGRAWQRERAKAAKTSPGTQDDTDETVLPGEAEAGVIWYERAQILHYTTLKDVNINQVQCLTLMAAFQASVNAMPMAWLLAGQAIRVAQDLGLHRSTMRLRMSFQEKQLRSRCWWAIYGLERMVSIALGRPLGVDDLDIDVAYPAEIDDAALAQLVLQAPNDANDSPDLPVEEHGSTMSGFVALTRLCKIAGRVTHVLYRPSNKSIADPHWAASQQNTINKLDKMLREWLANEVPAKYKDASPNRFVQVMSATLSNSYFAVLITLHRNFLPSNPDYPRPKPPASSQSLSHCVEAARSVIHVAAQSRVLLPPSHHLAVFCQYLWSSAVILLLCEVQAKDQVVVDAVEGHVDSCRRSLRFLEPVWPGCKKLRELLTDVERRAKEVVSNPRPKKRKSSGERKGSQLQPPKLDTMRRNSHSGGFPMYTATSDTNTFDKRARVYETSHTRTNMAYHDDMFTQPPANYSLTSSTSSNYSINPNANPNPNPNAGPAPGILTNFQTVEPFDLHFDIGGVNFDGLEMLQGFSGIDPASMWSTLTDGYIQTPSRSPVNPNSTIPGAGGGHNSWNPSGSGGQGTPTSQNGPSPGGGWLQPANPHSLHVPVQGQGQGFGLPSAGMDGTELWSQVAGGSFDWGADPSVPFNI